MESWYLVCYDVADERRLRKIYSVMKGLGWHLQYSVFLCRLHWRELCELKAVIEELISPDEDDVRIYPLPAESLVFALGKGPESPIDLEEIVKKSFDI